VRITGGRFRGRRLQTFEGRRIRPTSSRTREAAFHLLGEVEGTLGLDLFCGAGTFGLEAISRGTRRVVFVDRSPEALRLVRRNVEMLDVHDQAHLVRRDLFRGLPAGISDIGPFDWAFLDPPYARAGGSPRTGSLRTVLESLATPGILVPGGIVLVEHRYGTLIETLPGPFQRVDLRRYGDAGLAILRSGEPLHPEGSK
jgi:16S rRNA (guanine966-N2)-methyltransferase